MKAPVTVRRRRRRNRIGSGKPSRQAPDEGTAGRTVDRGKSSSTTSIRPSSGNLSFARRHSVPSPSAAHPLYDLDRTDRPSPALACMTDCSQGDNLPATRAERASARSLRSSSEAVWFQASPPVTAPVRAGAPGSTRQLLVFILSASASDNGCLPRLPWPTLPNSSARERVNSRPAGSARRPASAAQPGYRSGSRSPTAPSVQPGAALSRADLPAQRGRRWPSSLPSFSAAAVGRAERRKLCQRYAPSR